MNSFWFWFKFGKLKRAFSAGRATLFEADHSGDAKFALGSMVLLKDSRYSTTIAGEGVAAWQQIVADPKAISAALICNRCGFCHVIRARHHGHNLIRISEFGYFGDQYQGMYQSDWFRLVSPQVQRSMGLENKLVCQSCKIKDVPQVRLY